MKSFHTPPPSKNVLAESLKKVLRLNPARALISPRMLKRQQLLVWLIHLEISSLTTVHVRKKYAFECGLIDHRRLSVLCTPKKHSFFSTRPQLKNFSSPCCMCILSVLAINNCCDLIYIAFSKRWGSGFKTSFSVALTYYNIQCCLVTILASKYLLELVEADNNEMYLVEYLLCGIAGSVFSF